MSFRVTEFDTLDGLVADLRALPVKAERESAKVVRRYAEAGNRLAKGYAKSSAGAHGKHYHKAFKAEAITPLSWEYGPDAAMPQGGMSFEGGSVNQPPHRDLARSADKIAPAFFDGVSDMLDRLFW